MFYTYVLQSSKDKELYIGYSADLRNRLNAHNSGVVEATRSRKPFTLVYYEACLDETKAIKRENILRLVLGEDFYKVEFSACSSAGRADVLYTSGPWFDPRRAHRTKKYFFVSGTDQYMVIVMNIVELCSSAGTRPQRLSQASVLRWRAGGADVLYTSGPWFSIPGGRTEPRSIFCVRYRSIHGNRDEYS